MIQSSRYTVRSSIQIRHTLSRYIFEESGSYFGIRTILDLGISDPMYLCIQYRSIQILYRTCPRCRLDTRYPGTSIYFLHTYIPPGNYVPFLIQSHSGIQTILDLGISEFRPSLILVYRIQCIFVFSTVVLYCTCPRFRLDTRYPGIYFLHTYIPPGN